MADNLVWWRGAELITGEPSNGRNLTGRTFTAVRNVLAGQKKGLGSIFLFAGPAIMASIAYMDPGNFATNIQAGSYYGYRLLWVVLLANLIAMLFQGLSAKAGIVTGKNLAELCRDHFSKKIVLPMWVMSEIGAMATDLAEFLGGAIGLSLLLHIPLLVGMIAVAVITYGILLLDRFGFRPMEILIAVLVGVIGISYLCEVVIAPVVWSQALHGMTVPALPDKGAIILAVGIVGATVMPHAIYLHSGLALERAANQSTDARRRLIKFSNREVVIALTISGLINIAMVLMASAVFHHGHREVAEIETAYHTLTPLLGRAAASIFLISLIASGISSSVVGTIAGQMIMQGFVGFHIPVWFRRLITMAPAFVVTAIGMNATKALILSQVVLSFVLPIPMFALVILTRQRKIMGDLANGRLVDTAAIVGTIIIVALNIVLIVQTL